MNPRESLKRLYPLLPTRRQWNDWSLPTKLSVLTGYVALLGFIAAAASTFVSFTIQLLEEELYVEVGPYEDRITVELGRGYGNHSPPPITFAFPIKLVNASTRNIAIVDYEVRQLNCDYINAFDDTEAVRGLFADPSGLERREVPISMPSGSGVKLYARLGIASWYYPDTADPDTLTVRQYRLLAAREDSVDLFGNQVGMSIGVRGWAGIEMIDPDTIYQPVFEITFRTSRGSKVRTIVAPYQDLVSRLRLDGCGAEPLSRESPLMIDEVEELH